MSCAVEVRSKAVESILADSAGTSWLGQFEGSWKVIQLGWRVVLRGTQHWTCQKVYMRLCLHTAVFNIIIYGQWSNMGTQGAPQAGVRAFQALYFLTSFFNQLGPNATTWLVAGVLDLLSCGLPSRQAYNALPPQSCNCCPVSTEHEPRASTTIKSLLPDPFGLRVTARTPA